MIPNHRIFISLWFINENTENGISSFNRNLENKAKCQSKSRHQHRPLNADEKRSHRVQLERVPKFTKRSTLVVKRANRVSFLRVYRAKKSRNTMGHSICSNEGARKRVGSSINEIILIFHFWCPRPMHIAH